MKRRVGLMLLLLLLSTLAWAERGVQLAGRVVDKGGIPIIGSSVQVKELSAVGTVTNLEGNFSLTLPPNSYTLVVQFMGYEPHQQALSLRGDTTLTICLKESATQLDEVVVSATSSLERLKSVQIGVERVDIQAMSQTPALFGENDIIKSLTLLPGVKSEGDGSSGFQVRGGTSSQNLILLDEAPIYNSGHVLGIFSVFNDDALSSAALYKGQIPATLGGATSSVLDIQTQSADLQRLSGGVDVGLLSTKAHVELPVVKEKLSLFLSGRRSYFDLFLKPFEKYRNNNLYFYDFNAKLHYKAGERDRITLSYFRGEDKMGLDEMMEMKWGNDALTLKWLHRFGDRWSLTSSLVGTDYGTNNAIDMFNIECTFSGYIKNLTLKEAFTYTYDDIHTLQLGAQSSWIDLLSAEWSFNQTTQREERKGWENNFWINEQWRITPELNLSVGVRLNHFAAMGGSPYYEIDSYGDIVTQYDYASNEVVRSYWSVEPRASINYQVTSLQSIKAGFSRSSQNIHALRNTSSMAMPFDRYAMTSNLLKPQTSNQYALGYIALSPNHRYELSLEGYYKQIEHVYDFMDGKVFNSAIELERIILGGEGRAYGAELTLKKSVGDLTGWIGYTLSWVENRIPGINEGNWYRAAHDKRHDLSVVAIYNLPKGWNIAANFLYNTGQALTVPAAKYEIEGVTQYYYAERNGYRAPAYHRLDLSCTHTKELKYFTQTWSFGFYNLYNRYNPYMVYFENDDTKPSGTTAIQYSLFGIIPSLSYGITF